MPGNIVTLTDADIAAWPQPNYVHPEQRIVAVPLLATVFAVSSSTYLIRTWSRISWRDLRQSTLGWDDFCLFCGWGLSTLFAIVGVVAELNFGALRHMWDIPRDEWAPLMFLMFLGQILFIVSSSFIRISILLFYRRLTEIAVARIWKLLTWFAIGMVVVYAILWTGFIIFACSPISAFWNAWSEDYKESYYCYDTKSNNVISGAWAAATDLYVVILPLMITRQLPLKKSKRRALNVIFLLGLVTVALSIVRTYYHWRMTFDSDASYYLYNTFIAAQLEMSLGILCACAPACFAFQKKYISRPLSRIHLRAPLYVKEKCTAPTLDSTTVAGEESQRQSSKAAMFAIVPKSMTDSQSSPRSSTYVQPKFNIRIPPPPINEAWESMDHIVPTSPVRSVEEFAMQDWDIIKASRARLRYASGATMVPHACNQGEVNGIDRNLEEGVLQADTCSTCGSSLTIDDQEESKLAR